MSHSVNPKKSLLETSQHQDLQLSGQSKTNQRPKSRSTVKMPNISTPSPQFNQSPAVNKTALLKVSQRRSNLQHPSAAARKLKPQSFSQQVDESSLKSTGSINVSKLKHADLTIDTTNTSDHAKHLQDLEESLESEELHSSTSPMSPIKKTLQVITSNIVRASQHEPQSSLSPAATDQGESKTWASDILASRKANSYLNPLAKADSKLRTHRPPVIAKHSLINNSESSRIVKQDKTHGSLFDEEAEDEGFAIPNIGATKHSLKESGCVKAYAANTNQGLVRNYNEDRVSIILNICKPAESTYQGTWPTCSFFAVYDGHGGDACSDFLRDNLHQMIVRSSHFPMDPINALKRGFAEAEAKFLEQADKSGYSFERSGSCAIVVMVIDEMCYVANVGDSRAIMSCDRGQRVVNLSRDHKPSDQDEQARIVRNGGRVYQSQVTQHIKTGSGPLAASYNAVVLGPHRVYPGRLSVSRTFGDIEAKYPKYDGIPGVIIAEPEIKSFRIIDDCDFIVLASDGIYDRLSSEEVSKCVWNSTLINLPNVHQYAAAGVEYVMKQSLLKKTTDNITVVVIGFQGLKAATTHESDAAAEESSASNSLRPKLKKTNTESSDSEIDTMGSVRSPKKRFAEGRRADNIVRSKKGQEIIDRTDEMIQSKIAMANSSLKSPGSKYYGASSRSVEVAANLFVSPRMMKLNKLSFTTK